MATGRAKQEDRIQNGQQNQHATDIPPNQTASAAFSGLLADTPAEVMS